VCEAAEALRRDRRTTARVVVATLRFRRARARYMRAHAAEGDGARAVEAAHARIDRLETRLASDRTTCYYCMDDADPLSVANAWVFPCGHAVHATCHLVARFKHNGCVLRSAKDARAWRESADARRQLETSATACGLCRVALPRDATAAHEASYGSVPSALDALWAKDGAVVDDAARASRALERAEAIVGALERAEPTAA
jgi:hypothetical protein